jgi:hypothetical protein
MFVWLTSQLSELSFSQIVLLVFGLLYFANMFLRRVAQQGAAAVQKRGASHASSSGGVDKVGLT